LGTWDVSRVTNMQQMFFGARAFRQSLRRWIISASADRRMMLWMTMTPQQELGIFGPSEKIYVRSHPRVDAFQEAEEEFSTCMLS